MHVPEFSTDDDAAAEARIETETPILPAIPEVLAPAGAADDPRMAWQPRGGNRHPPCRDLDYRR